MAAGPIPESKKRVAAGVAADSIPSFWVLHVKSGCWDEWLLKLTYVVIGPLMKINGASATADHMTLERPVEHSR